MARNRACFWKTLRLLDSSGTAVISRIPSLFASHFFQYSTVHRSYALGNAQYLVTDRIDLLVVRERQLQRPSTGEPYILHMMKERPCWQMIPITWNLLVINRCTLDKKVIHQVVRPLESSRSNDDLLVKGCTYVKLGAAGRFKTYCLLSSCSKILFYQTPCCWVTLL
jgi:hypothetical protein